MKTAADLSFYFKQFHSIPVTKIKDFIEYQIIQFHIQNK
ncbi:hypothetical protein FM109_08790 [Vibrio casei]|nr:hypothetical protein FM109_08790 [Vibrio casei]